MLMKQIIDAYEAVSYTHLDVYKRQGFQMELYVKDIEKIWSSGGASLVAGKNGIMRKVESYDMMEQPKMKEWLREHVLLITTGYACLLYTSRCV